jgi:hypothetical protein
MSWKKELQRYLFLLNNFLKNIPPNTSLIISASLYKQIPKPILL